MEINEILISGRIDGKPKLRRPGKERFPILSFVARTEEYVGQKKRKEDVRWRGKCFGTVAEEVSKRLHEGLWIIVRGRLSHYARPHHKGETRMTEINVREIRIFPYPSAKFTFSLQDGGDATETEQPSGSNLSG